MKTAERDVVIVEAMSEASALEYIVVKTHCEFGKQFNQHRSAIIYV